MTCVWLVAACVCIVNDRKEREKKKSRRWRRRRGKNMMPEFEAVVELGGARA